MTLLIHIFLLLVGFALLIKGADFLVCGGASLGKIFGMSDVVIGLTVVAFGTSAPELVVNLFATIKGTADIAIGNIIGSNTANILLALGIGALIKPLRVLDNTVWKEIPYSALALLLVFLLANDVGMDKGSYPVITRVDGLLLILFFALFLSYSFGMGRMPEYEREREKSYTGLVSFFIILGGLLGLTLGGKLVVDNAVCLAAAAGLSQALIGLTIVALGTSLPELATSAVAAYKGKSDIAVGNAVGSNIFNLFWILGIVAAVKPLPFNVEINTDIMICIAATVLLFVFVVMHGHTISRAKGVVLVMSYGVYIAFICIRG